MIEFTVSTSGARSSAEGFDWSSLIPLAPHLIWAALLVFTLCWIGRKNVLSLFQRIGKVSVAGIDLEFLSSLEKAAAERRLDEDGIAQERAARRLSHCAEIVCGARILWVDDNPDNVKEEVALFREAGAKVTLVTSSDRAEKELRERRFDVLVSDIRRGDDDRAGLDFAVRVREMRHSPDVVFYVGELKNGVPHTAFGITERPTELVHLVLDVLARVRS